MWQIDGEKETCGTRGDLRKDHIEVRPHEIPIKKIKQS